MDGRGDLFDLFSTTTSGISVAQLARRYAMNANMVFKWPRDPRYSPEAEPTVDAWLTDVACFLPVEIIDQSRIDNVVPVADPKPSSAAGTIEIDIAGGHRLRMSGAYDPAAFVLLIRACQDDLCPGQYA